MTLDELIADSAKVPDDMEFEIPSLGKVKVGDIRKYKATAESARVKAEEEAKAAAQRLKEIEEQRNQLSELATRAAQMMEELERQKSTAPPAKSEEPDFENDVVFGPLVKNKLKPLEKQIESVNKTIQTLAKTFEESAKFVVRDYLRRRWNEIPAQERPKDMAEYLRKAQQQNLLDELGMPDPYKAWELEREPQRREQERLAAIEEGRKKALEEMKARERHIPRPGSYGMPETPGKSEKTFGSFEEMIEAAFNDPEIVKAGQIQ